MKGYYYSKNIDDVINELNSSEDGLSNKESRLRLEKYGYNRLLMKKKDSIFKIFLNELNSPMELILILTVVLSFFIGEIFDAFVLVFIILVDVIIGTFEEYRAKKDAQSLLNMIPTIARVIRDGNELEIDTSNIVIGDIMLLESGTRISADARIINNYNLIIDESSLTGESVGIEKSNYTLPLETCLFDQKNMVFAGTTVTKGRATVIVTSTGIDTEIGKIAVKVTKTKEEKSPLTIRMEKFIKQIGLMIILIAIIITLVLLKKNYGFSDIFLSVITLSVSAMPEGLSLALTMALTIASKRMAKHHVIVKNLNAVESLGSCTVIASDKTGTLTVNEQTAKEVILYNGERFIIGGNGYNDCGKIECLDGSKIDNLKYIAYLGLINNEASLQKKYNKWNYYGDSIDIAFISLAKKLNIERNVEIISRIPYESENQYSAVFYKQDNELHCTIKGSLEKVMFFSETSNEYINQNTELSKRGYRVIAIADGIVNSSKIEEVDNLKFIGMVAFIDPIRDDVKSSIQDCINAGIKVIMITGDHPFTAFAIAKELKLCNNYEEIATSSDLEKYRNMSQKDLDNYIKNIKVFARVNPIDKLEIVESLKRQGEFVAVTGDGVNDAPAIRCANIGIAMGSGTDVTKETASMIITDDNFTSIVEGVREGRGAYNNIRKIILFLLGCGLAEVLFFILSIMAGYDLPLLAIQLLWLNLVTDGLQDIALSFEKCDDHIMREKPRNTKESLFSKDLIIEVLITSITITVIVFGTWLFLMKKGVQLSTSRSIIMMLMVFIQNINVLNCRSEKKSIFKTSIKSNPLVILVIISSIVLQVLISYIPITAKMFKIEPLPIITIIILFLLSLLIIIVFEIYKFIRKKFNY